MGERLDAAARISARTVRAATRTPLAAQVRENLSFFGRVARAAATEALATPPGASERQSARAFEAREGAPHSGLGRQPADEFEPGDDERCTCRDPAWCGATRGDVVHDLMSQGMRLDRRQAESIWREAQNSRVA